MINSKRILIFGFGKEGQSAANYLGKKNDLVIFDEKSQNLIPQEHFTKLKTKGQPFFGTSLPANFRFDYIIRSPGVRPDHHLIRKFQAHGAILTSATKIFFDDAQGEIIGVTGTKGKGTTATLIYEMLKTKYRGVFLAGNIGTPALDILPKLDKTSIAILELSSFQLIDLKRSPHIAVVLMITQEHLDWHKDQKEYQSAKESIVSFQNSDDYAVINNDFEGSRALAQKSRAQIFFVSTSRKTNGVYLKGSKVVSQINGQKVICHTSDILLPGRHNLQNVIASIAVAKIKGVINQNITGVLSTFRGLVHRLQLVTDISGVKFYNDSFSTIPQTAIAAIEAFASPKILILGGSSKKSDFASLAEKIHKDQSIKALILIGQEAKRIKKAIVTAGGTHAKIIEGAKNMPEIITIACREAAPGDVVLLSPACASFDMFQNYQDRGEQFISQVRKLREN